LDVDLSKFFRSFDLLRVVVHDILSKPELWIKGEGISKRSRS
jgi:hypothetical protein